MLDVQNEPDSREIDIDRVGVSDLRYPIVVWDQAHGKQHTVARVQMSVCLPRHFKGTHMSRFIEVLNAHRSEVTMATMPALLRTLQKRLEAKRAQVEFRFPYFITKKAPQSQAQSSMDYEAWFKAEISDQSSVFKLGVRVPVTSLCPCSKAISDYGAHNQRGHISIEVQPKHISQKPGPELIWIEELIEVAEKSASAPVYALLKREDERYLTMYAYDHPVFVEDMIRNVASQLKADPRIFWFKVHVINHESIHNHGAFAELEWSHENSDRR